MWKWLCILLVCLCVGGFLVLRDKKQVKRPYLTVVGRVHMADGLGRQSVEVIQALKDEIPLNFIATGRHNFQDVPHEVKKIVRAKHRKHQPWGKVVLFEDCLWMPGPNLDYYKAVAFPKRSDQIRIAYSMFESTRIPQEWVLILNTYFDAIAVPDEFLIETYLKSGVKLPIFVLPLGLQLDDFLERPLKKKRNTPMVFANFSACVDRKNQPTLVRAFAKAFGNDPNVILRINSRYSIPSQKKQVQAEIDRFGLTNVLYSDICLEKYAYVKMFEEVDCYVSLSKGEGFSIQPREAMALGIPTVVTDNTAQHAICESRLVKRVSSDKLEPAIYEWGATGADKGIIYGHSFNCDEEEAAAALRDVYDRYDDYLKMSEAARDWVRKYEYKNLKGLYRSLVKPKNIILGKENRITEDCLITNSQELYEKYLRDCR